MAQSCGFHALLEHGHCLTSDVGFQSFSEKKEPAGKRNKFQERNPKEKEETNFQERNPKEKGRRKNFQERKSKKNFQERIFKKETGKKAEHQNLRSSSIKAFDLRASKPSIFEHPSPSRTRSCLTSSPREAETDGTSLLQPGCTAFIGATKVQADSNDVTVANYDPHQILIHFDCCEDIPDNIQIPKLQPLKLNDLNVEDLDIAKHKLDQYSKTLDDLINEPFVTKHISCKHEWEVVNMSGPLTQKELEEIADNIDLSDSEVEFGSSSTDNEEIHDLCTEYVSEEEDNLEIQVQEDSDKEPSDIDENFEELRSPAYTSKSDLQWNSRPFPTSKRLKRNIVRAKPGITDYSRQAKSIQDNFNIFIPDAMKEQIC
ncbi:hypothetical protein NQ318_022886 [Aromia moschata]|uniref:Uncharacterized protein n=1 Tax=Aromia moschata TaxID=1265417 RepID=A0AAV8XVK6_9CUCU|nr:hypothetical protein NQ318_022886 [Aromia moschata]